MKCSELLDGVLGASSIVFRGYLLGKCEKGIDLFKHGFMCLTFSVMWGWKRNREKEGIKGRELHDVL